jgi:hypothetical protein
MTQGNDNKDKPYLYWITLGIMFASFVAITSLSGCALHQESADALSGDIHTNPQA